MGDKAKAESSAFLLYFVFFVEVLSLVESHAHLKVSSKPQGPQIPMCNPLVIGGVMKDATFYIVKSS